jgi:hypothetical protein
VVFCIITGVEMKMAVCHPERKHSAKSLCEQCYRKQDYKVNNRYLKVEKKMTGKQGKGHKFKPGHVHSEATKQKISNAQIKNPANVPCKCGRGKTIKRTPKAKVWLSHCRKCENERILQWKIDNPHFKRATPETIKATNRKAKLLHRYGITIAQYNKMLEMQNFVCKICEEGPKKENSYLHVDHCHGSNRVRGLLCFSCNRLRVGKARDTEFELYIRIAEYLKSSFDGRTI